MDRLFVCIFSRIMSLDPPLDQQASDEFDHAERNRQPSSRLDVEGVTREKMLSFKKSGTVHLGYLNRFYKDVKLLMQNSENYREVRVIRKTLKPRSVDVYKHTKNIINSRSSQKLNQWRWMIITA